MLVNNKKHTKNKMLKPIQKTTAMLLSMEEWVGKTTLGATNKNTIGINKIKNKLSINAVISTMEVDLPKFIFSLFKINIATDAPPTTPGDNAEANSQSRIT